MRAVIDAKEFLLDNSIYKVDRHNQDDIYHKIIIILPQLMNYLKASPLNLDENELLQLVDTFSIWFLRVSQLQKKYQDVELIIEESRILNSIESLYNVTTRIWSSPSIDGKLNNALKNFFNKLLQFMKQIMPEAMFKETIQSWILRSSEIKQVKVLCFLLDNLTTDTDHIDLVTNDNKLIENLLNLSLIDTWTVQSYRSLSSLLKNLYELHYNANIDNLLIHDWLDIWVPQLLRHFDLHYISRKNARNYLIVPLFKRLPPQAFILFASKSIELNNTNKNNLITLLKAGQVLNMTESLFENNLIGRDIMSAWIYETDLKLDVFDFLTFSAKRSAPINPEILGILKDSLYVYFSDIDQEMSNYFISSFAKFIDRLKNSSHSLNREIKSLKKANKFVEEQQQKTSLIHEYANFFKFLVDILIQNMTPSTPTTGKEIAVKLLQCIVNAGLDNDVPATIADPQNQCNFPFHIALSENTLVLHTLLENFTCKKSIVREISSQLLFTFHEYNPKPIEYLVSGSKLYEKAGTCLKSYQNCELGAYIHLFLYKISSDKPRYIEKLTRYLENNPSKFAYGEYMTLTLIFEYTDTIPEDPAIILNFIKESSRNSIPYLSNTEVEQDILFDSRTESYAFKTLRESSNLIECLMKKVTFDRSQLIDILNMNIRDLREIRHSGAFQAVLPAFRLCSRICYQNDEKILSQVLVEILYDLRVSEITVSRRSGGIPLMVSNLLAAETQKGHPLFEYCFRTLLDIANMPVELYRENRDLPQVHALNCIRSIFTESSLAPIAIQKSKQVLETVFQNFESEHWALRNCSIMVFSSVLERIFGKNTAAVNSSSFFMKYEGLDGLLVKILQTVSASNIEGIFLALNIIDRLSFKPGDKHLEPLLSSLFKCLSHKHWKVRELSARVVGKLLIKPIAFFEQVMIEESTLNQNKLHGRLMVLLYLIENKRIPENYLYDPQTHVLITNFIERTLHNNKSYVTANLSIKLTLLSRCDCCRMSIKNFMKQSLNHSQPDGSKEICLKTAACYLFNSESLPVDEKRKLIESALQSPYQELQNETLNYIINNHDSNEISSCDILSHLKTIFETTKMPLTKKRALQCMIQFRVSHLDNICLSILAKRNDDQLIGTAMTGLLSTINPSDLESQIVLIEKYLDDSSQEDLRKSILMSLLNYTKLNNVRWLDLVFYKCCFDESSTIRKIASCYLKEQRSMTRFHGEDISPSYMTRIFSGSLEFSEEESPIWNQIIQTDIIKYLTFTRQQKNSGLSNGSLFEKERENQYKDDLVYYMQQCDMLEKIINVDHGTRFWDEIIINANCLEDQLKLAEKEKIYGWSSSCEIFVNIMITRKLLAFYNESRLNSFDNTLKEAAIHPLIQRNLAQ